MPGWLVGGLVLLFMVYIPSKVRFAGLFHGAWKCSKLQRVCVRVSAN